MTYSPSRPRFHHSLLSLFLFAVSVFAQTPGTGAIQGTVYDPSGLPLPRLVSPLRTKPRIFPGSPRPMQMAHSPCQCCSASYSLVVKVEGFEEKDAHAVPVVVSETSTVEVHLALAKSWRDHRGYSRRGDGPDAEFALGRAADQQAIEALPLANRNYTQILSLSPGVVVRLPDASELGRGTQDVTANGQKTTANNLPVQRH